MINLNIVKLFFHFAFFFVIIMLILECFNRKLLKNNNNGIYGRRLNIFGLLMELDNITIISLSILCVKVIFIIFSIFYYYNINLLYLIILLFLSILYGIFSKSIKNLLFEVISSFAVYFGLYCNGLLYNFMVDVRIEWYVILGMILLSIFLIAYTILFYLRSMNNLILKNKYVRSDRNEK